MKALILSLTLLISASAVCQINPSDKVFFGLLHAHTLISDGSGTPEEAFQMAKANKLDFFAVTPHNHKEAEDGAKERKDGVLIANDSLLYNGPDKVTVTRTLKEGGTIRTETISLKPLIKSANDVTSSTFLGLYGQEFSTISKGNHINVLGIDNLITVPNGDFKGLIARLKEIEIAGGRVPILQLNHPDVHSDLFYGGNDASTKKNMFNDYGIDEGDLGPDFNELVKAMDPYVSLIEVLSGPAMKQKRVESFRYDPNENDYYFYLKQGFHISPSVGQDNHYKTWGNVTDARIGVVAKKLTTEALFEAFRRNRTFATEDKNLKVILYVNDSMMGSSVKANDESELKFQVFINDSDEPNAEYEVAIFEGLISPEVSTSAHEWKASDGLITTQTVEGNTTCTIKGIFAVNSPKFYYAKITQNGSDRAWTAPVWVNEPKQNPNVIAVTETSAKFFWTSSSSSRVYHQAGCSSISRIKPENLMSGDEPPADRTKHNCDIQTEDTH